MMDKEIWNAICVSMDLIGDTTNAIEEYLKLDSSSIKYLAIYGILQALYLQQDALQYIYETLNLPFTLSPRLREMRKIRNKVAGHPVNAWKKKFQSFHFISQMESSARFVQLLSIDAKTNDLEFEKIDIHQSIQTQLEELAIGLQTIISELNKENEKHKKEFKDVKIKTIIDNIMPYELGKIYESALGGDYPASMVLYSLGKIRTTLQAFTEELKKRNLLGNLSGVDYLLTLFDHPIAVLEEHYQGAKIVPSEDRFIYFFFVEKHLKELGEMAMQIDEEYTS
ncbi:hypothetical protein [Leptospira barantonii]|nr:hypothetical protein [Leptospira barantonii]